MNENLTHENFSQNLNTKFLLHYGGQSPMELELIEITQLKRAPRQEMFSIRFRGPLDPQLLQRTFSLEHERMGAFELFLVAINRDEDGMYYEAVFNWLKEKEKA
ncbi:MAG TPA: hypothetical protein VGB17_10520 [Pyrinomonadaceae bacterium]